MESAPVETMVKLTERMIASFAGPRTPPAGFYNTKPMSMEELAKHIEELAKHIIPKPAPLQHDFGNPYLRAYPRAPGHNSAVRLCVACGCSENDRAIPCIPVPTWREEREMTIARVMDRMDHYRSMVTPKEPSGDQPKSSPAQSHCLDAGRGVWNLRSDAAVLRPGDQEITRCE